ncbi:hypothetical protein A9Q81_05380 [Gammaproteobacteria bacterium 42_54_T18]|nr:hypothetical protein A9Q81_05380 [Gammaproteobacteria bacterium 42_54_T18]
MSVEIEIFFSNEQKYDELVLLIPTSFQIIDQGEYRSANVELVMSEPDEDDFEALLSVKDIEGCNNLFSFTLSGHKNIILGQDEIVLLLSNVLSRSGGNVAMIANGTSILLYRDKEGVFLGDREFWSNERIKLLSVGEVSFDSSL